MSLEDQTFLGKGWSFPPEFNKSSRTANMVRSEDDIVQSLWIILSTRKGERIINPEFGCGIHDLVFEEIDTSIVFQIKELVRLAILYYEPRIDLNDIQIVMDDQTEGRININLVYTIKTVNKRSNMVYPFYFLEGTDLKFE